MSASVEDGDTKGLEIPAPALSECSPDNHVGLFQVSGALTPPFAGEVEGVMFRAWRAWAYDDFRAYA